MSEQNTPVAIARAFTEAWTGHDMDAAAGHLADDVTFDGPANHTVGAAAYMEALNGFAQTVSGMRWVAALGDDSQVLIMYEVTVPPGTMTCAEHLTFRGGKIATDRLTFAVTQPATS